MNHCVFYGTLLVAGAMAGTAMASSPYFVEPDVNVVFSAFSEQPGDGFGWAAEDLGDINGDGASDLITSAPFQFNGGANTGKVYVYSGADGTLLASHTGDAGELLGYSVSLAGDLNGDGTNDYVSGSLARVVAWSGADHSMLWQQTGSTFRFGYDVDTAGDVNGDGKDDVVVGETGVNGNAGAVHVLSGADGSVIWTHLGDSTLGLLGGAVGRLGDVDGDGVPDVAAGARGGGLQPNDKQKPRGIAYALSGVDGSVLYDMRPVGLPSNTDLQPIGTYGVFFAAGGGDVDGDGIGDVFVGDYDARRGGSNPNSHDPLTTGTGRAYLYSGANGHRLGVLNAESGGDGFGPGRIIPDVNGDGRDDVYVAGYTWGPNFEGKAYVMSRGGATLRTMTGTQPFAGLGVDAVGLDDVNGDGKTDFLLTGFAEIHVILGN